jgi:hypothetical protein
VNFTRGALLAGGFRTHHQLIAMSADDQRNTLIVEMANHSNQTNYQAFSDSDLSGVGALMVFLLKAGIRTAAQLKPISADDQRNIMIVEINGSTNLGKSLQGPWPHKESSGSVEQDAAADRVDLVDTRKYPAGSHAAVIGNRPPNFLVKVRQSPSVVTGIGKTYVVPNGGEVCKRFNRGYLAGNSNLTYVRMHSVRLRASR